MNHSVSGPSLASFSFGSSVLCFLLSLVYLFISLRCLCFFFFFPSVFFFLFLLLSLLCVSSFASSSFCFSSSSCFFFVSLSVSFVSFHLFFLPSSAIFILRVPFSRLLLALLVTFCLFLAFAFPSPRPDSLSHNSCRFHAFLSFLFPSSSAPPASSPPASFPSSPPTYFFFSLPLPLPRISFPSPCLPGRRSLLPNIRTRRISLGHFRARLMSVAKCKRCQEMSGNVRRCQAVPLSNPLFLIRRHTD